MKVFIAALDWGLGHATRVVQIVQQQINTGNEVMVGASARQIPIYAEHFPNIAIELMPSVSPLYSKRGNQIIPILKFIPRFFRSLYSEHQFLKHVIEKHEIEMVISDNRYGLYNKEIKSILITHQLNLLLPTSIRFLQKPTNILLRKLINRFDNCYIPDFPEPNSLSGKLSFPVPKLKCKVEHKKLLSRLSIVDSEKIQSYPELLVIISGPEKQRTAFEQAILYSLKAVSTTISYLIIRGIPDNETNKIENSLNHASAPLLKAYIENARYIICRAGYSTIMDLVIMKKTAMLVPTPGQTEQEYLAEHLTNKGLFLSVKQGELNIQDAIEKLNIFTPDFGFLNGLN
jgi:UDP-N-acetylglucosamine transferase subunit ALG13